MASRLVSLAGLALLAAGTVIRAQQDAHLQPDGGAPPAVHASRLLVRLAAGSGAELVGGALHSRTGIDLAPVARWFAAAEAAPLVVAASWDQLDVWYQQAAAVLPRDRRPGHLGLWFRLTAPQPAAAAALRSALAAEPLVEQVLFEPIYYPAGGCAPGSAPPPGGDLPPPTPSFVALQHAHGPSPAGHGARRGAGVLGARGRGARLYMIENCWVLEHEDVGQLTAANFVGPVPPLQLTEGFHGLSGASLVVADRNEYGITGIADETTARFLGLDMFGGFENAVAAAMLDGAPGDVLLVVLMVLVPGLGPGSWLPIEFMQPAFDAILTATANGRHVVIPAGNGDRSLDDPALLGRFDRALRDSGAIIVGASAGAALAKAPFSNWGSRIDAHSWGAGVVSCGYGSLFFPDNDIRQAYTDLATGTSSSTPHLAGLVAALQGAARQQLGRGLDNQEVIALLHAHGATTPDVIGRRPDLVAMLRALGAIDGLVVAEPDVLAGGTVAADVEGAAGAVALILGSLATANVPLGWNRNLHLDPATAVPLGLVAVVGPGSGQFLFSTPPAPVLRGVDLYLQAIRLTVGEPLFLTNSSQVTIL